MACKRACQVIVERSTTPSFIDGQIAAIASVNGLILVTRNIDDFKPFLRLKIENWHKE